MKRWSFNEILAVALTLIAFSYMLNLVWIGYKADKSVSAEKPVHNTTIDYGDGQKIEVYEEYPYRRLNDLNTHYVMKHGNEIYIEKVVDVTTGNVYFLTMSDKYGSAVSISPVYDSEGKILNISPSKNKE